MSKRKRTLFDEWPILDILKMPAIEERRNVMHLRVRDPDLALALGGPPIRYDRIVEDTFRLLSAEATSFVIAELCGVADVGCDYLPRAGTFTLRMVTHRHGGDRRWYSPYTFTRAGAVMFASEGDSVLPLIIIDKLEEMTMLAHIDGAEIEAQYRANHEERMRNAGRGML